jgi:hypothetical protein
VIAPKAGYDAGMVPPISAETQRGGTMPARGGESKGWSTDQLTVQLNSRRLLAIS